MEFFETIITSLGFLAIGIPAGFFAFLIFRISIHQNKFKWTGALTVITTLCGGGFLSYRARPMHFGLYAIGFLIGFFMYFNYLKKRKFRSSNSKGTSKYFVINDDGDKFRVDFEGEKEEAVSSSPIREEDTDPFIF